jgi:hypothetical protein
MGYNKSYKKWKDRMDEVTLFIIDCGNINFDECLKNVENQTLKAPIKIIKNIAPMSSAFQAMIDQCETEYYIQIDSDMILKENAVNHMVSVIKASNPNVAMVCFKLFDCHLNKNIEGIKIYKKEILKNFPYKNCISCEMYQIEQLNQNGFALIRSGEVMGVHAPKWTEKDIFERYYRWIEKYKNQKSNNYKEFINNLIKIYRSNPIKINFYAMCGAILSLCSDTYNSEEKDYRISPKEYPIFNSIFSAEEIWNKDITIFSPNKIKVVQICSTPCANRPYLISQLLNTFSDKFSSAHILHNAYSKNIINIPYREFPYQYLWQTNKRESIKAIQDANIIHFHHIPALQKIQLLTPQQKVIVTVSNISQSLKINNNSFNQNYHSLITNLTKNITTTNQPKQKEIYAYLTSDSLPIVKPLIPFDKIENDIPKIIYAPTNKHPAIEKTTTKGYDVVLTILTDLKNEGYVFEFDLIEGVPYEENLKRKASGDILIDDIINTNWHGTSIEAAHFGLVVLTRYSDINFPFLYTDENNLKENLKQLLTNNLFLKKQQELIATWANDIYTHEWLLKQYESYYERILSE